MTEQISMIELFSGVGAQERALRQLKLPYEVKHTCDCDANAVLSYAAMRWDLEKEMETFEFPSQEQMIEELQAKNLGYDFQKDKHTITSRTPITKLKQYYIADKLSRNLGDISKVEALPYVDIVVHSSPCQDYSLAGKGAGGDEGSNTRSSLMWESLRLIETSKPKYVLWENVAAVLSGKHRHNFIKYLERMSELGYENAFDLLNSKNFGVPQNRLRIFCVSRRVDSDDNIVRNINDMPKSTNKQVDSTMKEIKDNPNIRMWTDYKFPETIPLTIRLKDILEKNVDEKYYLPDDRIEKILNSTFMQEKKRIQTTDVCDTLLARDWKDPKCVPVEDLEPIRLGGIYDSEEGRHQAGAIWDKDAISPTLDTMQGGNRQPFIVTEEPFIVASRGRNPENPSDRTTGVPTEQRLEPNFSGCTNTLTSVQKDNYVCEPQVLRAERTEYGKAIRKLYEAGEIDEKIGNMREMKPRTDGVSNTITTVQKDNYVAEPIVYDDYNSRIGADQDAINTLTCNCGASAERNGVKIIEPVIVEDFYQSREPRVYSDTAPTIRSERVGLKAADGEIEYPCSTRGKQVASAIRASIYKQGARNLEENVMNGLGYEGVIEQEEPKIRWRIRKLTSLECWRLMNFSNRDHNRAAKYVAASGLYKQAGNSIVVAVLTAIMCSLFIEDGHKAEVWTKYMLDFND